ncbi:MAG TPA: M20 family metallopeptidase [Actinomycetota bacterium]|nr:M20 family metallopeptidase [Actinomycetota bacterium]
MRDMLEALVSAESPSNDPALCAKAARVLFDIIGGAADETVSSGGHEHYVWRWGGEPRVLLIGHLDTVWPAGTINRWPFTVDGERATGPGCFDMKAGLVIAGEALRALGSTEGVTLLVNTDEELGSGTSQSLIEAEAAGATATLVLEPGHDDAMKVARKGVAMYVLRMRGRAAHAGLEPENGVNAIIEAAHQVRAIAALGDQSRGTTVTPTVLAAGSARNVVPALAVVEVDARFTDMAEAGRVDTAMRDLTASLPGAAIEVTGGVNRPPLERRMSERLYALAREIGPSVGWVPGAAEVGGGSDGNYTAAMGIETIDGLGGRGGNAHAEGEWIDLSSLPARARMLAALIERIRSA